MNLCHPVYDLIYCVKGKKIIRWFYVFWTKISYQIKYVGICFESLIYLSESVRQLQRETWFKINQHNEQIIEVEVTMLVNSITFYDHSIEL